MQTCTAERQLSRESCMWCVLFLIRSLIGSSLSRTVEISLCGHSCATIYLLTVLGAVPVLHSDDTRCCSVSPSGGDGQCRQRLRRGHWPMWFAPVCIIGVFRGCVGRLALFGRPGFRSVCVSLLHVKNPVQWTRNDQRGRSLSGALAVQTFTKVTKGSNWASCAHKGKRTLCGKLLLVRFQPTVPTAWQSYGYHCV